MTHLKQWLGLGIAAIALTTTPLLTSCGPKATKPISETNTLPNKPAQPKEARNKPSAGQGPLTQGPLTPTAARKVTFRQPNGAPEFSLQFKATGGKLTDRSGKVIANLILESDGAIRLTDASNKTVGYISELNGVWQIESSQRSKALFTFSREANGDAMLKRNNGSAVYTLKAIDSGGYAVSSDKGGGYTVSARKGNGLLQTGEGERILVSEGAIAPAALASFGFNKLSQAQRAGLAYALATEATTEATAETTDISKN
ncbi:MAG: hypothetical protein AAFO06_13660 [Cyanobacteria bacterium J06597_16]